MTKKQKRAAREAAEKERLKNSRNRVAFHKSRDGSGSPAGSFTAADSIYFTIGGDGLGSTGALKIYMWCVHTRVSTYDEVFFVRILVGSPARMIPDVRWSWKTKGQRNNGEFASKARTRYFKISADILHNQVESMGQQECEHEEYRMLPREGFFWLFQLWSAEIAWSATFMKYLLRYDYDSFACRLEWCRIDGKPPFGDDGYVNTFRITPTQEGGAFSSWIAYSEWENHHCWKRAKP